MGETFQLRCVLFDLDGTLVDTAPDLIASMNYAFLEHGHAQVDAASVRPFISHGAAAMIQDCLGEQLSVDAQAELLNTMLACYEANIAEHSQFFPGIPAILSALEALGVKWGVVTNKRERFTTPLMAALGLDNRAACIVSGDTTPFPKPHPEPMWEACKRAAVKPTECVYIGDASHDITAGKRVAMKTLAAVYGYLKPDDQPETWGADALIRSPDELMPWLEPYL